MTITLAYIFLAVATPGAALFLVLAAREGKKTEALAAAAEGTE